MFRSLILAAVLMASAPLVANAGEITLLPSVNYKLAIAIITVTTGTVAAGVTAATGIVTMNGVTNAGTNMTTATIVAGINVTPMNAVIAKAGEIVMTIAAAKAMVVATVIITDTKKAPRGAFFIIPLQCQSAATDSALPPAPLSPTLPV